MMADEAHLVKVGREQFVEVLRNHPALLVCGSIFKYLVAKVFEAMAAGTLAICDIDTLGEQLTALGFQEGVHYLGTTIFTVYDDVKDFLDNWSMKRSYWTKVVSQAKEKVFKEHSTTVRATQIHNCIISKLKMFQKIGTLLQTPCGMGNKNTLYRLDDKANFISHPTHAGLII